MLKRLKQILSAGIVLATILLLAGCGPKPEPAAVRWQATITDDSKATVTLTARPERIVSLSPSLTEILFALGLGDRVVGVTSWDDYPPEVKQKPVVGDLKAGAEAVLAQNPHLVLASGLNMATVDTLRQTKVPVLVFDPQSMEDIFHTIIRIAQATGVEQKGQDLTGKMQRELTQITASLPGTDRVTVFIEVGWDPLFTAGNATFLHDITTLAGGQNIAGDVTGWVQYSTEDVIAKNPAVIITTTGHGTDPVSTIKKRPGWDRITAIQNGRVVVLDPNLVYRPGPRSVELVRELARNLYPAAGK
ncbi:MAG: ABC transporter substrate-binding protein [Syntrophomonadaceae bacterium]|jgi:iron complex transport system substrate-binding protein|nr:ABC transporter substrate-binding protein [Syntrophomonadaceae bacterium]